MIKLRSGSSRGLSKTSWLYSQHSFSFANYYDPAEMGFSVLQVINDDRVAPQGGFATHSHQDMEIISVVLEGQIAHRDSMGNEQILNAGDVQWMSAGTGITHSEYNPSADQPLHFLQIWLLPWQQGLQPAYQERRLAAAAGWTALVVPQGEENEHTLPMRQDARLYQGRFSKGETSPLPLAAERCGYVHVISGEISLNSQPLSASDGARISDEQAVELTCADDSLLLFFDLPL